jgi:hypothetical protein
MRWYVQVLRKNEVRIPKKVLKHDSKRKMPKRTKKIKMETTVWERRHTEIRKNMARN